MYPLNVKTGWSLIIIHHAQVYTKLKDEVGTKEPKKYTNTCKICGDNHVHYIQPFPRLSCAC